MVSGTADKGLETLTGARPSNDAERSFSLRLKISTAAEFDDGGGLENVVDTG